MIDSPYLSPDPVECVIDSSALSDSALQDIHRARGVGLDVADDHIETMLKLPGG